MNFYILSFLAFGSLFGLLTYTNRHLFSEGPTRPAHGGDPGLLEGRMYWVVLSGCLWPVLVVSGIYAVYRGKLTRGKLSRIG
jgi:hypothetical protein